jgi:hypothetical protein
MVTKISCWDTGGMGYHVARLELRESMARQLWELCGGDPAATPPSVI